MRVAAALFVAAAVFAWVAGHGLLRLGSTGTAPPAIVLRGRAAAGPSPSRHGRARQLAVPRRVEVARLGSVARGRSESAR